MSSRASILGQCLEECGYLTQIASMADAAEVTTDGPLLQLRNDGKATWVPLDAGHRAVAWAVTHGVRSNPFWPVPDGR
jgi:hypothetical protein